MKLTWHYKSDRLSSWLKDIVTEPSLYTLYPKIVEIQGSDVLTLNLAIYNKNIAGPHYDGMTNVHMSVQGSIGQIKVTFLNKNITDVLWHRIE